MTIKRIDKAYLEKVKELSDELIAIQAPIRILDSVKWGDDIKEQFFKDKCKKQPRVTKDYYLQNVSFNIHEKEDEFLLFSRKIEQELGKFNTVGQMLKSMCQEYGLVLRMLNGCGTPDFSMMSQLLYGSSKDVFHEGDPNITQLGSLMAAAIGKLDKHKLLEDEPRKITPEKGVKILQSRLAKHFHDTDKNLRVLISDGIVSDAAAGADYIKLRKDALFNKRDLRLLEIHEGMVHIGTTLNGMLQPYCTFLSKGPPSVTVTQEGLAVLMEILSFASYPLRIKKLANRIRAIELAEDGATFLDVFRYFCDEEYDQEQAYASTTRVFRGSLPELGPFTKDLSYSKGFVMVYNFIQLCVKKGELSLIPLLFCGKVKLEDIREISQLVKEGIIRKPKYLPPQIKDLNAISAWMCFSGFINLLTSEKIESDYASLFDS